MDRAKELYDALHSICLSVSTAHDVDGAMQKVVVETTRTIGCESALIAVLEKGGWTVKHVCNLPPQMTGNVLTSDEALVALLAAQEQKSVCIQDALRDKRISGGLAKKLGIRSVVAVPLTVRGSIPGILLLNYHARTYAFTESEIEFADKLKTILFMTFQNADLLERSRRNEEQIRRAKELSDAVNGINTIIHSSLDYDEIMQRVVMETARAIGAGSAMIYVKENGGWQARYVYGLPAAVIGRRLTQEEVGYSVLSAVEKRSIVVNHAARDSRVCREIIEQYGIQAVLDVALTVGDDLVGDFVLHHHEPGRTFDELVVDFVNKVAASLTSALKNARLYEDRRNILGALRESEERFRSAFAHAASGMLLVKTDGRILQVNRALCKIFGYSEQELLEKTFQDLTYPDDLEASRALLRALAEGKRDYGWLEKRCVHRDGRVVWALVSVASIRDTGGEFLYFVAQMQDITGRKQAEEALKRAAETGEQLQRCMVAISNSGTFDDALKTLLDAAVGLTGMEGGGIYLVERDVAVLRYHSGLPEAFIRLVEREPMDRPMVQAVLNQTDLLDLVERFEGIQVVFKEHGMCHAYSIPLRVQQETFGFLNVGSTRTERPAQVDIQTLKILATGTEALLHRLLAEEALRQSEERFRGAFAHAAFGMALVSPERRILQVNRSLCQISGYSEYELLNRDSLELTHPDDQEATAALLDDLVTGSREFGWLEKRYLHRDGHVLWAVLSIALIRDGQGKPLYFVSQIQDITARKQAEEALRESQAKLNAILQNTPAAVYMLDAEGRFIHVNRRFEELFGFASGTATGRSLHDLFPRETAASLMINNQKVMEGRRSIEFEEVVPQADGLHIYASVKSPLFDASSRACAIVGVSTDISERKRMEDEIRHMANHDALTGLPNRRFYMDIIELEVAQARRNRTKLAVLFLDLDRFKEVNDTLGHEAGDELLKQVAVRIRSDIRASDTVARIGGDEFNLILSDITRPDDVAVTLRKIMDSFRRPFLIAGQELIITTSVGVSIYPDDSREIDTLFRFADIALYQAKDLGKNAYYFYNPDINRRSVERIRLERSLRQSIERQELTVYYQPQVDIRSGRIISAEALVRWRHPDLGMLDPQQFIPAAEDTGFVAVIDAHVLKTACVQIRSWLDDGLTPVRITVNLSAREFQNPDLAFEILSILRLSGTPPEFLDVEITETLAMSNIERTISRLNELARMGVHSSIDVFGTGLFIIILPETAAHSKAQDRPIVHKGPGLRSRRQGDRAGSDGNGAQYADQGAGRGSRDPGTAGIPGFC